MDAKMTPVICLKNIGPRCAEWLAQIGVHSAEDLKAIGAAVAYQELVSREIVRPHRMLLYALAGAIIGTDCVKLSAAQKRAIEEDAALDLFSKRLSF